MTERQESIRWWANILGPQVIALIIGAFAAYMTANVTLARLDQRTTELEAKVKIMQTDRKDESERLIRLETKIDLILDKQISRHHSE